MQGSNPSVVGIIPAYNEEANIAHSVRTMLAVEEIGRVVVVDGYSTDGTVARAKEAGAEVIQQKQDVYPGKGIALETAIEATNEDVLVVFDADIHNVEPRMVRKLMGPVLAGEADFAKAAYERKAGRVTVLTARPLLKLYFPEIQVKQPLSGEFVARRAVMDTIHLEKDWGLESGLLIDAYMGPWTFVEVDIGYKEHDMKDLDDLRVMSQQVARTILKKAVEYGRYRQSVVAGAATGEESPLLAGP